MYSLTDKYLLNMGERVLDQRNQYHYYSRGDYEDILTKELPQKCTDMFHWRMGLFRILKQKSYSCLEPDKRNACWEWLGELQNKVLTVWDRGRTKVRNQNGLLRAGERKTFEDEERKHRLAQAAAIIVSTPQGQSLRMAPLAQRGFVPVTSQLEHPPSQVVRLGLPLPFPQAPRMVS